MGEVGGNILAGTVVAIVVATIAWLGTDRFARRLEDAKARHERHLAAAEELYAAYGQFLPRGRHGSSHAGAAGPRRARSRSRFVRDCSRRPLKSRVNTNHSSSGSRLSIV
jgi:hypothetical protein